MLLLVPVAAIAGYGVYLGHLVTSNVQTENLLPALTPDQLAGKPGEPVPTGPGATPVTGKGLNFLFIGSDAGPDRVGARADVIILAHIPEDRHDVTLIHFPRDLYVDIPGHGKDKINASYAYGGAPLLVETLQGLAGAHVDHVAKIGFEGFKNMTDAVGGVNIYVAESSSQGTFTFVAGTTMHMNGDMALEFVRSRYQLSQGDISRGQRQQEFLKALMLKVLSGDTLTNPVKVASPRRRGHQEPHRGPEPRHRRDAAARAVAAQHPHLRRPVHHGPVQRVRHDARRRRHRRGGRREDDGDGPGGRRGPPRPLAALTRAPRGGAKVT